MMPPKAINITVQTANKGGGGGARKKGKSKAAKSRARRRRNFKRKTEVMSYDPTQVVRFTPKMKGLVSGAGNSMAARIAYALALPSHHTAIRFPDQNAESTDVKGFKFVNRLTHPSTGNTSYGFDSTDFLIILFGQPACMYMYWRDPVISAYTAWMCYQGSNGADLYGQVATLFQRQNGGDAVYNVTRVWDLSLPVPIVGMSGNAGFFHGAYLPGAVYGLLPEYFIYMNRGDTIVLEFIVTYSNALTGYSGNLTVEIYTYDLPGKPLVKGMQYTGLAAAGSSALGGETRIALPASNGRVELNIEANNAGWYAFTVTQMELASLAPGGGVDMLQVDAAMSAGVEAGWSVACSPDFLSSTVVPIATGIPQLAENARVNACSLLITNTTSLLNRGGSVNAARIAYNNARPEFLTKDQLMGTAEDTYTGDAANGVYTFMENTEWTAERHRCATGAGPLLTLGNNSKYHYIAITAALPQTYTVTCNFIMEYKVASVVLANNCTADGRLQDLLDARRLINESPEWFFENPLHMSQIFSWIKKGAKAFLHYAPTALTAAGAASGNPAFFALAAAMKRFQL